MKKYLLDFVRLFYPDLEEDTPTFLLIVVVIILASAVTFTCMFME